jgi:two-component system cell cycle response regulator
MARIRLQLRTRRLCEGLLEENETLARDATTDPLTGLRNRRFLVETLGVELSRSRRHGSALAILLVDLDGFKGINDRFGHAAGDAVLGRVARLLASKTRTTDFAARYGGDELVWVLTQNTDEGVKICAERLRREIETTPFEHAGKGFPVTISIGIAHWDAGTTTVEQLIARADEALYRAKQAGRNRVEVAR